MRWQAFLRSFAVTAALAAGAGIGGLVYADPYWLFSREDQRAATRVLDVDMRRSKALQIVARFPRAVIIGSSVVYRGVNPPAGVYNAGVSSLMSDELPVFASIAVRNPFVDTVVIGLDYFMFTDLVIPVRISPSLQTLSGYTALWMSAVMSRQAYEAARETGDVEPGAWRRNGFRASPDRAASQTVVIDQQQRDGVLAYQPERLGHLQQAIDAIGRARRVIIYLSPVSDAQWRNVQQRGFEADYRRWAGDIRALARSNGATFHDLGQMAVTQDFDPCCGSSPNWLDNLHFKPAIGAKILAQVGIEP